MKLIGLTGGIGMGKSTAEQLLCSAGIPVIDTDRLARQLVEPGTEALREVINAFGQTVLSADGQLSRHRLAEIVFSDPVSRKKLEAILHPRIRRIWREQVGAWNDEGKPVAVVVIPLLFETRAEDEFDQVICIACSKAAQYRRLGARGWSVEHIQRRLMAQWSIVEKMARSDFVVWTEGPLEITAEQLARIIR